MALQARATPVVTPFVGRVRLIKPATTKAPALLRRSLYASAQQQDTVAAGGVEDALAVLERAAADGGAPPVAVFQALRTLEKAKLPVDGWPEVLGDSPGGKRWRLVFTSGTKQVSPLAYPAPLNASMR